MWLSYIIPVFNGEALIRRCLTSLLRQGLHPDEYEVIVVDDGSTDNTPHILDYYTKLYPNIVVHRQSNSGAGVARNAAIRIARGDYLCFVDADDWILDNGLATLKQYIDFDNPRDLYSFWSRTVDAYYDPKQYDHIRPHRVTLDGTVGDYIKNFEIRCVVWGMLYNRKLLIDNDIWFPHQTFGEDTLFSSKLFQMVNLTVLATSLNIYRYFVHTQSAINTCSASRNLRGALEYQKTCHQLQEMSESNAVATSGKYTREQFNKLIPNQQEKVYTRMLGASKKLTTLRQLRHTMLSDSTLPIQNCKNIFHRLMNLSLHNILLLYGLAKFYRRVYVPIIKPRLPRN